jgi:hypothetical protein
MSRSVLQFCQQWQSRLHSVCDYLERDDFRYVSAFMSWEEAHEQIVKAQENIVHQTVFQEFAMFLPSFANLKSFIENLSVQVSPRSVETSIIWGLIGLITKVLSDLPLFRREADRILPALSR